MTVNPTLAEDGGASSAQTSPIVAEDVAVYYGDFKAVTGVTLAVPEKGITAIIGPSGCGKSTFLRSINRTLIRTCRSSRGSNQPGTGWRGGGPACAPSS